MLYMTGTIVRKDGKRMTRKRADAVFDAFLGWLEDTQGCLFGGGFNPSFKDGGYAERHAVGTENTMGGQVIDLEWLTVPKKPKRKAKR